MYTIILHSSYHLTLHKYYIQAVVKRLSHLTLMAMIYDLLWIHLNNINHNSTREVCFQIL